MLRTYCFLGIFVFLIQISPSQPQKDNSHSHKQATFSQEQKDSTDVLEAVLEMQRNMPEPSRNFRQGHIQPAELNHFFELTERGYTIQLPFKGMTPSPTIYKGIAYISGGFGSKQFFAFDARTGKKVWAINLDDDGPSSAVVEDDIVVFNTESCTIFAVEAYTGKMIWSHWLGDPLMSTPTIAKGRVFTAYPVAHLKNQIKNVPQQTIQNIQDENEPVALAGFRGPMLATHVLVAFDLKTGEVLWQKWLDGDIMSAPVAEGKELFITTFPGTLYRVDQKTGEILSANASRATSAPVIVERSLLVSQRADTIGMSVAEKMGILDRNSASQKKVSYSRSAPYLDQQVQNRSAIKTQAVSEDAGNGFGGGAPASSGWQAASLNIGQSNVSSLQSFHGSRILHYRNRNFSTMGDELVCVDHVNDSVLWRKKLKGDLIQEGGFLATPPLVAGDKIIIGTLKGEILILNPENGAQISSYSIGEGIRYQPVIDKGNIYLTTIKGKMYCIRTGDKSLDGWHTWGADAAHSNKGK